MSGLFGELLAHPGVEEIQHVGSRIGFMAIHGGLEEGTAEIASEAAGRCGASLYGVVLPDDLWWHVPSRLISPDDSPALAAFIDHVDVAISIHGYGREGLFKAILLGGGNRDLAARLRPHLERRLDGYEVVDELDRIPSDLRGLHPENPVNGPSGGGVQVELPPRVRGMGPFWENRDLDGGRAPHTDALIDALAGAALALGTG